MSFRQVTILDHSKQLLPLFTFIVIFLIEVFFSLLLPAFQGPDEQVHYATIQHLAEPTQKNWEIRETANNPRVGDNIQDFHFSQEVIQSAQRLQFDELKWQSENTQTFSNDTNGIKEDEIRSNQWPRYLDTYPANTSGTRSFYYNIGSKLERLLGSNSIIDRFYIARFLSVLIGLGIVIIAYRVARSLNFPEIAAILFSTLVGFQPMFLATAGIVNIDILLIFAFSLFFLVATLLLTQGLSFFRVLLLGFALLIGLFSKGPGIVLFIVSYFLGAYLLFKKMNWSREQVIRYIGIATAGIIALVLVTLPPSFLASILALGGNSHFSNVFVSLWEYAGKTLGGDAFFRTFTSYWGNFGWLDTKMPDSVLSFIAAIEIFSTFGLVGYLLSKVRKSWLPQKVISLLALGIIIALQLAIRFYDWRIFDTTGKILIGTPGRYFLPNIIPHMLLVVTGLGFFTKNEKQFQRLLLWLALGMILLSLYALFFVILPRYYL